MEINKSKTIEINWLGHCPTCDREEHMVSTFVGDKDYLYEDDTVKCWCGQTGVIEADDGHAWCKWDEKTATEWDNFNIYYRQKYPEYWELLPKANHQACTHHEELFNSWVTAKSQVVPEGLSINLSGHDIQTIANFMCYEDPENLDSEVTIQDCKAGFNGAGIYAWVSEYPEEGGIKLGEAQEQSHESD